MDIFLNFSEVCFEIKYQIFKFKKILNFSKMMSVFSESEVRFKMEVQLYECLSEKFFTTHIKVQMENNINSLMN